VCVWITVEKVKCGWMTETSSNGKASKVLLMQPQFGPLWYSMKRQKNCQTSVCDFQWSLTDFWLLGVR